LPSTSCAEIRVSRAERAFESARGYDPGWAAFFTDAELAGAAGSAFRMLGDAGLGVRHLHAATGINGRARNRTSWVLQLAEGLAAAGDPAQASAVATSALPIVSDLASTRVRRHVRRVAAAVAPHAGVREVREFHASMSALGLAS